MSKRLQAGKDLLEKGQFEQAIKELSIQISSTPEDIQAIFLRGVAFRKLGKLDASLKDFDKAIKINPLNPDLFSDRAIVYHLMDRGNDAMTDMNTSVSMDDKNAFRYSCRAYMRDILNDTDGAMEDYSMAIQLDPTDEISQNNLGLLQEKLGKMKEASQSFKAADEILKKKGKYIENSSTKGIQKDELKVKRSADGAVSFESPKKQKKIIEKQTEKTRAANKRIGLNAYLNTLKKVFSSKEELNSFLKFIKDFFVKS